MLPDGFVGCTSCDKQGNQLYHRKCSRIPAIPRGEKEAKSSNLAVHTVPSLIYSLVLRLSYAVVSYLSRLDDESGDPCHERDKSPVFW